MGIAVDELATVPDPVGNDEADPDHLLCETDDEATVLWWCDLGL